MGAPLLPNKGALIVVRTLLLIAVWSAHPGGHAADDHEPQGAAGRVRESAITSPATYAARTMRWGGVIILLFVIYHLGHLTFGKFHPDFIEGDVYHNFVTGFQVWWASAIYIIANLALGMHLYHGLWSMFNSLGLNHARFNRVEARLRHRIRGDRHARQHLLPDRRPDGLPALTRKLADHTGR